MGRCEGGTEEVKKKQTVRQLLQAKKGLLLDLSWGGVTQPRSVTLNPHGDIKQAPTTIPFKLPSNVVHTAVVTHVLEFLPPHDFFKWWDELWRVMQVQGTVYVSGPYGGDESQGWLSDPTHQTRIVEASFEWLDPQFPWYALHKDLGRPTPKPWFRATASRVPGAHGTISYNCALIKVASFKATS